MPRSSLRVLYFGTYDPDYPRNRIVKAGLRAAGVEVRECRAPLWRDTDDKVAAARTHSGWLKGVGRVLQAYVSLWPAYREVRHADYDIMLLGYIGHFDVFLARWLSRRDHKPLVLDVLMSLYLIAHERGLSGQHLLRLIEGVALRLPDLLIQDTVPYVAWFEKNYGIPAERFRLVPLGADDRSFRPMIIEKTDDLFRVVYHGSFIPNHGVLYIVEAAHLLADVPGVHFELVGDGPDHARAVTLSQMYGLRNITFTPWLPLTELVRHIARAEVCLGVFGMTPQSLMTVHNKIKEGLAMAKPVITGDSPAVRLELTHGEHVYLCERANPRALADAILTLRAGPTLRAQLAQQGHRRFSEHFTVASIGQQMRTHLESLLVER